MQMRKGLVFIILVNYNGWNDTIECVDSILKCNYENYKICVVDNASSDDSARRLKNLFKKDKYKNKLFLICSSKNLGFSGGNNKGIFYALSNGAEYILLLNNDTLVHHNFLTELVNCSLKFSDNAAIGAKIYYKVSQNEGIDKNILWYAGGKFNRKTGRTGHIGMGDIDNGQYDKEKEVSFITGCCILINKNIIERVGLMPEDYFLYCEDLAYSIELQRAGIKMIYNPQAVIYHKLSASTGRNSEISVYYSVRNKLYIIKKYIDLPWRIFAQFVFLLENIKRILCGRYESKGVIKGYADYYRGLMGKQ